jgi:hypothetical protein
MSSRADGASAGVLFHGDRGVEYAAFELRTQLAKLGMLQSMNRAGKMNDKRRCATSLLLPSSGSRPSKPVSIKAMQVPTLRQDAAQCRRSSCTARPLSATCRSPLR